MCLQRPIQETQKYLKLRIFINLNQNPSIKSHGKNYMCIYSFKLNYLLHEEYWYRNWSMIKLIFEDIWKVTDSVTWNWTAGGNTDFRHHLQANLLNTGVYHSKHLHVYEYLDFWFNFSFSTWIFLMSCEHRKEINWAN